MSKWLIQWINVRENEFSRSTNEWKEKLINNKRIS